MMAGSRRSGSNFGSMFLKGVGVLILLGLLIAVLRVFNWDPFGVVTWIWDWFALVVTSIADFFTGNDTFRKVTSAPN